MIRRLTLSLRERPGRVLADLPADLSRAAVAAVLSAREELLFIRRSERVGDPWSGHVAFPGGRAEDRDPDAAATARRETWEEVGLDLGREAALLGPLDEVAAPARRGPPQLRVSPFVFQLRTEARPRPNAEVAAVQWVALERLVRGEGRGRFALEWGGMRLAMPCIELDGMRIWGLTLRMVDDLVERLGGPVSPEVEVLGPARTEVSP